MKTIINYTWEDVTTIIDNFVKEIKPFYLNPEGFEIIGIGRGGLIPAQLIAYGLNVPRVHSLGLSYYERDVIGGKRKMPIFYQGITTTLNNNILIVDDIVDNGSTLDHVIDYLKLISSSANIITFTLFAKKKTAYKVNYYGSSVEDDLWVKFPWDK